MPGQKTNPVAPPTAIAKIAAGQGFFTPCAGANSLLNTLWAAAKNTDSGGGTVSLSPTDFGFDQIRNDQHLGEAYLPDDNLICLGIFRGKFQSQE